MGLFLGSLGVSRAFLMVEEGANLPSDFEGITMPRFTISDKASVAGAITRILKRIELTRKSFNLKPIPSATLALGYFENFLRPFAAGYWKRYDKPATVKILLPRDLIKFTDKDELNVLIEGYHRAYPSEDESIYQPGTRPTIKKIKNSAPLFFWDVPTTIFTLKQLFEKMPSNADAVGVDEEKKEWLSGEVEEFAHAVIELVSGSQNFQLGITLETYWLEMKGGQPIETPLL
jgi:nucleotide-binding STING sensor domain-containing protein